jgi:hypothetical protein
LWGIKRFGHMAGENRLSRRGVADRRGRARGPTSSQPVSRRQTFGIYLGGVAVCCVCRRRFVDVAREEGPHQSQRALAPPPYTRTRRRVFHSIAPSGGEVVEARKPNQKRRQKGAYTLSRVGCCRKDYPSPQWDGGLFWVKRGATQNKKRDTNREPQYIVCMCVWKRIMGICLCLCIKRLFFYGWERSFCVEAAWASYIVAGRTIAAAAAAAAISRARARLGWPPPRPAICRRINQTITSSRPPQP